MIFRLVSGAALILAKQPYEHPTATKLHSFRDLNDGWSFGRGKQINKLVIDAALRLHAEAVSLGLIETDAFPGEDGEVRVTIYEESDYLEFTFEKNGVVTFIREQNDDEVECEENLDQKQSIEKIRSYSQGRSAWRSFASLTLGDITTEERNVFKVYVSKIRETGAKEAFRSSTANASMPPELVFVATSPDITKISRDHQQHTGMYQSSYFQPVFI